MKILIIYVLLLGLTHTSAFSPPSTALYRRLRSFPLHNVSAPAVTPSSKQSIIRLNAHPGSGGTLSDANSSDDEGEEQEGDEEEDDSYKSEEEEIQEEDEIMFRKSDSIEESSVAVHPNTALASTVSSPTKATFREGQPLYNLRQQWKASCSEFKSNPLPFITIPIVAAVVGYITNYVGVKMLFYPISWKGIPIKRYAEQPLGVFGWQGIVPAKRYQMSRKMVDVTISQLLNLQEVFAKLKPSELAKILAMDLKGTIMNGLLPRPILLYYLKKTSTDMLKHVQEMVDIKKIVVDGLCSNPATLGIMFQQVAGKELKFLVDSGMVFGFFLGIVQMFQWMVFPAQWTLPVGGAVVGFITNWIALKWIFEPLVPTKVGPFVLQGMFLRRQKEVSRDFCAFVSDNILNSQAMWTQMVGTSRPSVGPLGEGALFREIIARNVPIGGGHIDTIMSKLQTNIIPRNPSISALHKYTDNKLDLKATLTTAMNKLSPEQFEKLLHPIFQEDEITLIVAGGVLGAMAGGCQWAWNKKREKDAEKRSAKSAEHTKLAL